MIYMVSLIVFSVIIFILIGLILLVEAKVVTSENCTIVINDDPDKTLTVAGGKTLLSVLSDNKIYLPSACGGGGSCGTCKCKVTEGGQGILPTESAHLSRKEKMENIRLACQLKVKEDLKISISPEILNVKKYTATVVSNENIATYIKQLIIRLDNEAELNFKAGAFVQIDIPEYELSFFQFRVRVSERFRPEWDAFNLWGLRAKSDEPVFRAYSLANPPSEKTTLSFTIRIATPPSGFPEAPPGTGSSYIFNLKPEDKVVISGPYGDFFAKKTNREMCYIGGGAGMAPLKSHIVYQLDSLKTGRKITFWYGARSMMELFFEDEFKNLEKEHDNFSYHISLSRPKPEDNWSGMTGYIHDCVYENYLKNHKDPSEVEYYLCGPPPMIDSAVAMLDDLGVEPEMIAFDMF